MQKTKTIIVRPLNWGLGHATRLVPIISNYLQAGAKVITISDEESHNFLSNEFPHAEHIRQKTFKITYAPKPFFYCWLFIQAPFFLTGLVREYLEAGKFVKKFNPDLIISDNCYGFRHSKVKSIIITHQLFIKVPLLLKPFTRCVHYITRKLITPFDECWVPDYSDKEISLAGSLSHGQYVPKNVKYIGPLSRFKLLNSDEAQNAGEIDVLVIVSGPEPYRSRFEQQMRSRYSHSLEKVIILQGKPGKKQFKEKLNNGNMVVLSHVDTPTLRRFIINAKKIVSRSGYSTIMDLHVLNKTAEWHPTPGQSEQKYLAWWQNVRNKSKEKPAQ